MKALVLGGNGFVGMNLLRALVRAGHDAVGTRRQHTNTLFARRIGAPLVTADLDDEASLVAAMEGRDVVFMCAGHYPRYSLDLEGEVSLGRARMRRALAAAKRARVERFVLTSSVSTVGPPRFGERSTERDPFDPKAMGSVYHRVKLAIEEEALGSGLDVVVLLPTAIFGELDVKAGTGFLIVALANDALPYFVEGRANVVDADDLAVAHIAAAERGRAGERYAIGGHDLLVSELLERVANTLSLPFRSKPVPAWLAGPCATFAELRASTSKRGERPFLSRELVDVVRFGRFVDDSKARRELALPAPTPLTRTLQKACDWYLRHRYVPRRGESHAPS